VPEVAPGPCMGDPGHRVCRPQTGWGPRENQTFLPCQGGWQVSRCPDRNLNRYAGTRPVHQAASVTRGTSEKRDKPHPRPERSVLLAVDQEFGECATLWVAPELSDPVGSLEVGQHEDVEKLGERAERGLAGRNLRWRTIILASDAGAIPRFDARRTVFVCSRPFAHDQDGSDDRYPDTHGLQPEAGLQ
jgi:hypothetical protein